MNHRNLFKVFMTFVLLLICAKVVNGQWNFHCGYNLYSPPFTSPQFIDAEFTTKDTGLCVYKYYVSPSTGDNVTIIKTSNGGVTWSGSSGSSGYGGGSYGIYKIPKTNTFYIFTSFGGAASWKVTHDGGITYQYITTLCGGFNGFFACDTSKYYFFCGNSTRYLSKYDHGITYTQYASFPTVIPKAPFFPDTAVGFIAARDVNSNSVKSGMILKTSDGGLNWSTVFTDTTLNFNKIFFIDTLTGFACGDSGLILKTIDGGTNWQYLNSGVNVDLNCIYFIDDSFGFIGGDSGTIIRTVNGGLNWTLDQINTTQNITKLSAVSDTTLMAMAGVMYLLELNNSTSIMEDDQTSEEVINIFPNPSASKIFITFNHDMEHKPFVINLYNNLSKILYQDKIVNSQNQYSLDVSHLPNGMYNIIIHVENKSFHKTFIVER